MVWRLHRFIAPTLVIRSMEDEILCRNRSVSLHVTTEMTDRANRGNSAIPWSWDSAAVIGEFQQTSFRFTVSSF